MPPRLIRRLFVAPAAFVVCVIVLILSPILMTVAAIFDIVARRRWRTSRLVALSVVFSLYEAVGLVAVFLLWLGSGFGLAFRTELFRRAHVALLRGWLNGVAGALLMTLGLQIDYEPGERRDRAVLVFSRHAGPGDSVFLTRAVMRDFDRQPRVVAKKDLQWAPFFDAMGGRLPHHFVDPKPADRQAELDAIEALARGMDEDGALVLFPEGGNFTVKRRERAITSLERRGEWERATKASDMPHLIAPRPGGAMAAMRGAPEADIIFVAHSGMEDITSVAEIYAGIPFRRPIKARYWRVPAEERPEGGQEQVDWLFRWWSEIDRWIADNYVPS